MSRTPAAKTASWSRYRNPDSPDRSFAVEASGEMPEAGGDRATLSISGESRFDLDSISILVLIYLLVQRRLGSGSAKHDAIAKPPQRNPPPTLPIAELKVSILNGAAILLQLFRTLTAFQCMVSN